MEEVPFTRPRPRDEPSRLRLLEQVLADGSLLRGALDLITDAIAASLGVPVGLVSLVGPDRQHFVGQTGMPPEAAFGTPISHSFCQHVVARAAPLVIENSSQEPLVSDNPAVEDLGVLAFSGQPIVIYGQVLGAVCAIDHAPRRWLEREVTALRAFADLAEYLIRARLSTQAKLRDEQREALVRDRQQTARLAIYEAQTSAQQEVESLNRRLQNALLPRRGSPLGRQADVFYESGSNQMLLGGDFADTVLDADGNLSFVVGDVTGHGPEAAALAIGLRSSWHALQAVGVGLAEIIGVLDRLTGDSQLFATLLIGRVAVTGQVHLLSAGHPPPIASGDHTATELTTDPGPMLGLGFDGARWAVTEHALGNRTLIAYTDGLIEGIMHPTRERFGVERLLSAIAEYGPGPERLCALASDANAGPLPDDVAILRIHPL